MIITYLVTVIDKIRQPTERKELNKLDPIVTNKIENKYQHNDAIEYEPKFDIKFILSSGTKDSYR